MLLGLILTVPDEVLGAILLAFFAGFFLYVGAAELLPEAHRRDRSRWVVLATLGGALAIYVFSHVARRARSGLCDGALTRGLRASSRSRRASSSATVGMPSRAPARVTASEAAATARRARRRRARDRPPGPPPARR